MKTLHRIDFPAQMAILVLSLASAVIEPAYLFFGFYFGIGGWQLLMATILAFRMNPHPISVRLAYEKMLLVVILFAIPCLFRFEPIRIYTFYYLFALLFVGFGMALWNMSIAYREWQLVRSEHQVWDIE